MSAPRAMGYCRASTKKQVESPEVQKAKIEAYAKTQGLESVLYYVDPATSGKMPVGSRAAGKQLLIDLRPGDHVIITKLDRMFRKQIDCLQVLDQFERMGIKFHVINLLGGSLDLTSPIGRCIVHILSAFAQLEREFISERTREGLAHRKKAKVQYCHYSGYGFKWVTTTRGGKNARVRAPDPVERNVMSSIVNWKAGGQSWDEIVRILRKLDIKTREGKWWDANRIRRAYRAEIMLRDHEKGKAECTQTATATRSGWE